MKKDSDGAKLAIMDKIMQEEEDACILVWERGRDDRKAVDHATLL